MSMECAYHPGREPVGACVECGRLICADCKAMMEGKIYCTPCADKKFAARGTQRLAAPSTPPPDRPAVERPQPTGNPQAVATSTTGAAEGPSEKKSKPRGRGWLVGLVALAILVAIFGGGYLWLRWPDFPPRPLEAIARSISSAFSREQPLPKLDPLKAKQVRDETAALVKQYSLRDPVPNADRAEQLRTQMQASGLPVQSVSIVQSDKGQPVLAVGVRYQDLGLGAGLPNGVNALRRLVDNNNLSLTGLHDVTVFVEDKQERLLFGVSAPVATIEAYRARRITQQEFLRSMALKGESRMGVLESLADEVRK